MIIRDEKTELLAIINSIPAKNYIDFGYGVSPNEIYNVFDGVKEQADFFLLQLEQEGKVEIFRKPEFDDMILAVRTI